MLAVGYRPLFNPFHLLSVHNSSIIPGPNQNKYMNSMCLTYTSINSGNRIKNCKKVPEGGKDTKRVKPKKSLYTSNACLFRKNCFFFFFKLKASPSPLHHLFPPFMCLDKTNRLIYLHNIIHHFHLNFFLYFVSVLFYIFYISNFFFFFGSC